MNGSWEVYFLELAKQIATRSEDPSTQVGAVITNQDHSILSTGYNGLPRGVTVLPSRLERPMKYKFFEHAERNAIYNAARIGANLYGSTIYLTSPPCTDCARAIIQSGIQKVCYIITSPDLLERWKEDLTISSAMLYEAGVQYEMWNT